MKLMLRIRPNDLRLLVFLFVPLPFLLQLNCFVETEISVGVSLNQHQLFWLFLKFLYTFKESYGGLNSFATFFFDVGMKLPVWIRKNIDLVMVGLDQVQVESWVK